MGRPISIAETEMEKKNETSEISTLSESFRMSYNTTKPSWLTSTLSDLDTRMKALAPNLPIGDNGGYSFRERADFYYDKRPQLIELLQDLHNGYLALSDKYTQSLLKQNLHCRHSSLVTFSDNDLCTGQEDGGSILIDSNVGRSRSFHQQPLFVIPLQRINHVDDIVTNLVITNVEMDILVDEVSDMERQGNESSRKIDLQKSLIDVLESERLMLLNENAQLYSQVRNLKHEKRRLSMESFTVKRKANEMAKFLLKTRDKQRLNMIQKMEDLHGQIRKLEKENDCYEQLVNREYYQKPENSKDYEHKVHREKADKSKRKEAKNVDEYTRVTVKNMKNWSKWWAKIRVMDLFRCGYQAHSLS